MNIAPGYDFFSTEVPTRAKLFQMAAGMSITGIDLSQIDATLVGSKLGNPSAVSLPGEGWINYDTESGRLFVRTRFGTVATYRGGYGGWETRRYKAFTPGDTWGYPINDLVPVGSVYALGADSLESSAGYRPGTDIVGPYLVKNAESAASGANLRLVGRGGYYAEALTAKRTGMPDYTRVSGAGVQDQEVTPFPAVATDGFGLGKKTGLLLRKANGVASPTVRDFAWYFGLAMHQD